MGHHSLLSGSLVRTAGLLAALAAVAGAASCGSDDDTGGGGSGAAVVGGGGHGGTGTGTSTGTGQGGAGGATTGPGGQGQGGNGQGASGGADVEGWLYTDGNQLLLPNGQPFRGRGANIHDTRSCWACAWLDPNPAEVERRMDELIDGWHANFIRFLLESYPDDQGGAVQWQNVIDDPDYLEDVVEMVSHATAKPGVYVLLSLWADGSFSELGWPTTDTIPEWELLAETFRNESHVLFGLVNEPESNFDGSLDADCWQAMNDTVAAIRAVEDDYGTPHHVIAVQGTRGWGRTLDYYVAHPITAGGGENIVYETHVYNPTSDFQAQFLTPAQTLPVIIGEFGPSDGYMTTTDCENLMDEATDHDIPHLAWTFHMRCDPNLLVDNSGGGCGEDMTLTPTAWGTLLQSRLATAW